MVGHYERRWSQAARWCERAALLALPYFGLTILLHRFDKITSIQAVWLLAFGVVLLGISLLLGLRALFDLWNGGYRGGKATVRGVVLACLLLAPFIWYGYLAVAHPPLNDVATDPYSPPQFPTAGEARARAGAAGLTAYDADYAELLVEAYPKLGPRRYQAGPERVLAAARALAEERGWRIGDAPPPDRAGQASESEAGLQFEAVAETFLFGFESDVVVVVQSEAEATLVDMRSASRFGNHDFGYNAALIESFLADLDTALIGIAGEG